MFNFLKKKPIEEIDPDFSKLIKKNGLEIIKEYKKNFEKETAKYKIKIKNTDLYFEYRPLDFLLSEPYLRFADEKNASSYLKLKGAKEAVKTILIETAETAQKVIN